MILSVASLYILSKPGVDLENLVEKEKKKKKNKKKKIKNKSINKNMLTL